MGCAGGGSARGRGCAIDDEMFLKPLLGRALE